MYYELYPLDAPFSWLMDPYEGTAADIGRALDFSYDYIMKYLHDNAIAVGAQVGVALPSDIFKSYLPGSSMYMAVVSATLLAGMTPLAVGNDWKNGESLLQAVLSRGIATGAGIY